MANTKIVPINIKQMLAPAVVPDEEAAAQRLAMAQAMQQAAQKGNMPEAGGPVQAKYGIGTALADLGTRLASAYNTRKAQEGLTQAKQSNDNAMASSLQSYMDAPTQNTLQGAQQADASPYGAGIEPLADVAQSQADTAHDKNAQIVAMAKAMGRPAMSAIAGQLLTQQMTPKVPEKLMEHDPTKALVNPTDGRVVIAAAPKETAPSTNIGKAVADLKAGNIDQNQFTDLVRKETYIPPNTHVVPGVDDAGKPTLNLVDGTDGHVVRKNIGIPGASAAGDSRAQAQNDRVIMAANEAGANIHNLTLLPTGASSGILGVGGTPGHSLFSVSAAALKNAVAPQDVQSFNALVPGLAQSIASVEAGGLQASTTRIKSFDGFLLAPNDTGLTKLQKMAGLRQNVERGLEVKLANPRIPEDQKEIMRNIMSGLKEDIPFTVADVLKLANAKNPQATLGDLIKSSGVTNQSGQPTPSTGWGAAVKH